MFADFHRRAQLPEGELVPVDFTPERTGEYEFTCGIEMLRGKVLVK